MDDDLSPAQYAVLRTYLEVGKARYAIWKDTGSWPTNVGDPSNAKLVAEFAQALPALYFEPFLTPAEAEVQEAWYKKWGPTAKGLSLAPALRRGDVMFRDPASIRKTLDFFAPTTAAAVAAIPGSETAGVEWWAVALAAGGALWWIGKLDWRGALVAAIAARALVALAAYLAYKTETPEGGTIVQQGIQAVKDAAAAAANAAGAAGKSILWVVGVVGAAALAFALRPSSASNPTPRSSSSAAGVDDDPPDGGPHPGALPPTAAALLLQVYEEKRGDGYSKVRAAKQAWGAVKRAGWRSVEAADGGEWWFREGQQSDLLLHTLLQLEERTGIPADEMVAVWAEVADLDEDILLSAINGETELEPDEIAELRAAARALAAQK